MTPDDRALDLEFAFTAWPESCRDPYPTLQQCRRRAGHEGQHAAGFGAGRNRWDDGECLTTAPLHDLALQGNRPPDAHGQATSDVPSRLDPGATGEAPP